MGKRTDAMLVDLAIKILSPFLERLLDVLVEWVKDQLSDDDKEKIKGAVVSALSDSPDGDEHENV